MSSRRIGLIANVSKPRTREIAPSLVQAFESRGIEIVPDIQTGNLVDMKGLPRAELAQRCELVVTLGGDGTILEAQRDLRPVAPPLFGINLGSLGFLTSVGGMAWKHAVDCIANKSYHISQRTLLQVELLHDGKVVALERGLNDAVLSRGELSRLIRLNVSVDGAPLTEYNADGLIIATPTGSTAYALSAGGPVLTPESGVFVIAPICPHVLTMRPVIVGERSVIEITPTREASDVFLSVDGQSAVPVRRGDVVRITRAEEALRIATLPDTKFFEVLRQKLKWSGTAV
jgi:NAD+ kinase